MYMSAPLFGKRHREVVGLDEGGGADVVDVLGRERRRREAAALAVDALVVREPPAVARHGVDLVAAHARDVEHEAAVVEQQRIARAHVARELLVVQAHARDVAGLLETRVEDEGVAGLQHHLAILELAHADLRALEVDHDPDRALDLAAGLAHELGALHVVRGRAVREVQPHDVDAGEEHPLEGRGVARSGAERGDDLGAALCFGHQDCAARCSRISIAGSFLPSRNSRKAPPPVEM
jgi:hypothetical protein